MHNSTLPEANYKLIGSASTSLGPSQSNCDNFNKDEIASSETSPSPKLNRQISTNMSSFIVSPLVPLPRLDRNRDPFSKQSKNVTPADSKPRRQNPTLEKLLQPDAKELSTSEAILEKMRNLRDRIRQHAVQTSYGSSSTNWPPPNAIFGEKYSKKDNGGNVRKTSKRFEKLNKSIVDQNNTIESNKEDDGIVCTNSDIKAIIASIREFEKSVQQTQEGRCIEVVYEKEEHLIPCLLSSPLKKMEPGSPKPTLGRKQVSFIDPKKNKRVVPESPAKSLQRTASAQMETTHKSLDSTGFSSEKDVQLFGGKVGFSLPFSESLDKVCLYSRSSSSRSSSTTSSSISTSVAVAICAPRPKSPPLQPRDIEYDSKGFTWDVYGADIDPEILGRSIQTHLIKQNERKCDMTGLVNNSNCPGNLDNAHLPSHLSSSSSRTSRKCKSRRGNCGACCIIAKEISSSSISTAD